MGTECHYFICDVGNREEVYQTAKAVREKVAWASPSSAQLDTGDASQRGHFHGAWERALVISGHLWGLSRVARPVFVRIHMCAYTCECACVSGCYRGQGLSVG